MIETEKGFTIPKNSKAIPGIKRLMRAEAKAKKGQSPVVFGIWYVDGIPYDVHTMEEAQGIHKLHEEEVRLFAEFNAKINRTTSR